MSEYEARYSPSSLDCERLDYESSACSIVMQPRDEAEMPLPTLEAFAFNQKMP